MKIIDSGTKIYEEFNSVQLTLLKQLIMLKIEEEYPNEEANMGFMIFKSGDKIKELTNFFDHDSIYVEFFFNRKESIHGMSKIILYNGDEPDEVLDCISFMEKNLDGFKHK